MFIVVEGMDGSGKTTLIHSLFADLIKEIKNQNIFLTKEPSDSFYGRLLKNQKIKFTKEQVLEYFIQDRQYHLRDEIKPILKQNKIILCDRYYYSTIAYQGINHIDKIKENILEPELVFYLKCSPEISIKRIVLRNDIDLRYESIDILKKVHKIYEQIMVGENIYPIDCETSILDNVNYCKDIILKKLNKKGD